MGISPSSNLSQQCLVSFGLGEETSKRTANIRFPIKDIRLDFKIHLVKTYVSILICIDDVDSIDVYLNNLTKTSHRSTFGIIVRVSRICEHPFHAWNPFMQCHFTPNELYRLHQRLKHPLAN